MRLKISGPKGLNKVISLEKEDSLGKLLKVTTPPFEVSGVRFGYPPQTISISEDALEQAVDSFGISSGEKIVLIESMEKNSESVSLQKETPPVESQPVESPPTETKIDLPDGTCQLLRVHKVPDDNSCLFHAISYCNYKDISVSQQLRSVVADKIRSDPIEYSEAVLDKRNDLYAQWIMRKDSWGGGIEIALLSETLGTAIFVLDMDAQQFEKFNEDRFNQFMIILFNGIHYDSIELSSGRTIFDKNDDYLSQLILSGSLQIAKQMKQHGYSFNTRQDKIICNICNSEFAGEKDVAKHAKKTGHIDFGQASS
ncbi:hypothetical protein HG535_0D06050 [Zygotorulaspora mrakii]|uniref:Ubiquitin thioesterase OTU n=1 Tax=Zygotorulaspora mrakii TaxID=42260 RepID=A0A7H9B392_ZYGMR|nr:uncharacterized protein HG535_0D06050 [Zygotorulaspora mrakii]QLG72896.1 hypothetical protein HG535_0D06050 [Zygotorulaspora mrakii]